MLYLEHTSENASLTFPYVAEVPPHLKKLVKFIGRAFYQPQQIVVLDILAKYPWYVALFTSFAHMHTHTCIILCIV